VTLDDATRRLLLRCRATLHGCQHESELDLERPERAAVLARRVADIDAALGAREGVEEGGT